MFGVNSHKYIMACARGGQAVFLRAASIVMGQQSFDALVQDQPFLNLRRISALYAQPDPYVWVPGDAGYIDNTEENSGLEDGENVIYVGGEEGEGCFVRGGGMMSTGRFWGHHPGIKERTLEEWFAEIIIGWGGVPEVYPSRRYFVLEGGM